MWSRRRGGCCAACTSRRRRTPTASWCAARAGDRGRGDGHPRRIAQLRAACRRAADREAGGELIWIPPGFAHGCLTLEPGCEVVYKMTDDYDLASEQGIAWDDPAPAIDWRLDGTRPILSDKDRRLPRLADAPPAFTHPG